MPENRTQGNAVRDCLSPKGAGSYSPGRSAAQAWDLERKICVILKAPQGRDNCKARIANDAAIRGGMLSRPYRAFALRRLSEYPGLRCAPTWAIGSRPFGALGSKIRSNGGAGLKRKRAAVFAAHAAN